MIFRLYEMPTRRPLAARLFGILMLSVLLGATFFYMSRPSQAAKASSLPLVAHSEANGLAMSVYLTPGPYFLGELVAVDFSITNHSDTDWYAGPPLAIDGCGRSSALITGNNIPPDFAMPLAGPHSCASASKGHILLPQGQTLTVHKFVPLLYSGQVSEYAPVWLYKKEMADDNSASRLSFAYVPFGNSWSSVHLYVNPSTPKGRRIPYSITGAHIRINAPMDIRSKLEYRYGLVCQNPITSELDSFWNPDWEALKAAQLSRPHCSQKNGEWYIAFGAPGYKITSLSIPFQETS